MASYEWPPSGGGSGSAFQAFAQRYVDPSGSDSTGDGSVTKPWQTISHALSAITDNASGKQYTLNIAPGTYTENIAWKPWIFFQGQQFGVSLLDANTACNVTIIGNITCPDSTLGNFAMTGVNVNGDFHTYTTTTTARGPFYFYGCRFFGTNFIIGDSATYLYFDLTLENCVVSCDTTSFYSIDYDIRDCFIVNNLSIFGGTGSVINTQMNDGVWSFSDDGSSGGPEITLFSGCSSPTFTYGGTVGAVLQSDPAFTGGSLAQTSTGAWTVSYRDTQAQDISNTDYVLLGDITQLFVTTGDSNRTVALPASANYSGKDITITKIDSGSGHIIIGPGVSGGTQSIVTRYGAITVSASESSGWYIKSRYLT